MCKLFKCDMHDPSCCRRSRLMGDDIVAGGLLEGIRAYLNTVTPGACGDNVTSMNSLNMVSLQCTVSP
jgi:hypothetical protein